MTPPPRFSEEDLLGIFKEIISPEAKLSDEMIQMMKQAQIKADLSFLGLTNPEEELKKFYIPPSGKKAATLPPRSIIVGADIHGCNHDGNGILKTFVSDLMAGEDTYLVLLGDYIHGLKAVKDTDKGEVPIGPAYPDKSLEVILKVVELRHILGDRFIPLIGDHDLSLIFPDFNIFKHGVNETQEFSGKLTDVQKKFLKECVSRFPVAARTQNNYILVHAGAAPMVESWEQLENLELQVPLEDKLKWANETIEGRLLMGRQEKVNGKPFRIISYEDNKKFLKAVAGEAMITGHSARATFFADKNGKRTVYNGTLAPIFEKFNQIILTTTEGNGCEKMRDSQERNLYGKQFVVDSSVACGTLLYSYIGENAFRHFPIDGLEKFHQETPVDMKKTLTDRIIESAKSVTNRGGFGKNLFRNLVDNRDMLYGFEIEELNEIDRYFRENNDERMPEGVPNAFYLGRLPIKTHDIFLKPRGRK